MLRYPDYLERNIAAWKNWAAESAERSRPSWEQTALHWGIWNTPESEVGLLRDMKPAADVVELGCGTGSLCAALARNGHRPVGVDVVRRQLEYGAELAREFGVQFPLLCANAERLHYGPQTFDVVISDYGASVWCNPYKWMPEAYRLLRPQGLLIFLVSSTLVVTCTSEIGGEARERLMQDHFSRFQIAFDGEGGAIEFHLTHAHWVDLLRSSGFVLWRLIETQPREDGAPRHQFASLEWAQRWPTEEIWVARKLV